MQKHRGFASEIKTYIEDAYKGKTKPSYVLLIGDAEFIPCHYETNHSTISQGTIGTDLYYATVDGDDYIPDIHVGRLSVDTLNQTNKRVNDIITYEKNPPTDDDNNFYTHSSVAAYFQDGDKNGYEDRRYVHTTEEIRDYLEDSGYSVDRIYWTQSDIKPMNWSNESAFWPGTGEAIPDELKRPDFDWDGDAGDISGAVNEGRFLIIHRDHGHRFDGWVEPEYTTNDVENLTNETKLPVVWSINCQTGWFDNETDDSITGTLSSTVHFAEAWERNTNGGAIGIIAATRNSPSAPNDRLAWGWMDAIWPNFNTSYPSTTSSKKPLFEMGAVLTQGKLYLNSIDDYEENIIIQEFELFHWFGDPTMQIWTEVPQTLNVSHPATLPGGTAFVDVTVNQADALISISRKDKILGKALSQNGTTTVPLSKSLSKGDVVYIVVTKHNFRPYEGTLNVLASSPCQVTNENDKGDGSLRQILAEARSNGCSIITFASGVSTIKIDSQVEISSDTLTIDGQVNNKKVTVSGQNKTRVFFVYPVAKVMFQNLIITNGKLAKPTHNNYARGAGIFNNGGIVTIADGCSVRNNVIDTNDSTLCYGGGIYNTQGGTLIVNGTVSNNTVYNDVGGGGIWNDGGTVIVNGTVSGNTARGGGGITNSSEGKLTINATGIVENNTAARLNSNFSGMGGGIYNSGELIVRGTITGNKSDGQGGGIYTNTTITVQGGQINGNTPDDCAGSGCL